MPLITPTVLLFMLNLLDALLTIIWVRSGVATEGNQMMARLLEMGDWPFLAAKIAVGIVTAVVILRWGNRPVARYGLTVALAAYISLMGIHLITGLEALGYVSANFVNDIANYPSYLLAVII
jgi:hypothetical protein